MPANRTLFLLTQVSFLMLLFSKVKTVVPGPFLNVQLYFECLEKALAIVIFFCRNLKKVIHMYILNGWSWSLILTEIFFVILKSGDLLYQQVASY